MLIPKLSQFPRFSYALSREYPYSWVTPVAILGGIVAITLITIINFATLGFDLVATSTNNPNETIANANPFGQHGLLSRLARGVTASCTSTTLPIGTQIFSTNYAIPYALSSVWRENDDNTQENLGSLIYMNQPINCTVTQVIIRVLGKYTQSPLLSARTRVGLQLETYATCSVHIDVSRTDTTDRPTYFELRGSYNLLDEAIPHFLLTDKDKKASLYWGQSLLSVYSLITSHAYFVGASNFSWGQDHTYNAYIGLTRASNATQGSAEEVMSDEFFHVGCYTEENYCGNNSIPWLSQGKGVDGHQYDPYANIWSSVDVLGKAMWFTVMTDLGQNDTAIPNMLVYPDLLVNLTSNLTNEVNFFEALQDSATQTGNQTGTTIRIDNQLAMATYDPSDTSQGALGAQPSFLSTDYICQVPKAKSGGIRALVILMSDLVFLQTLWAIFKMLVDYKVGREGPAAMYCEGCLGSPVQESSETVGDSNAAITTARKPYVGRKSIDESDVEMVNYEQVRVTERHVE